MNEKKLQLNIERGKRLKILRGYTNLTQDEFGKKFDLNWAQIKDRESGTVEIKPFLTKAIEKEFKFNHQWLMTGQGEIYKNQHRKISESQSPYPEPVRISDPLIQKTAAILESPTIFSAALKSNIEAFHYALACEEKLAVAIKRIEDLENWKKEIEKRLPAIVNES